MERIQTTAVCGRVPADVAERLERATGEVDRTKSQLIARAIAYYVEENPDDLRAFYPDDPFAAFVEELCR